MRGPPFRASLTILAACPAAHALAVTTSRWISLHGPSVHPLGVGSRSPCGPLLNASACTLVAVMLSEWPSSARHAPIPQNAGARKLRSLGHSACRETRPTYTRCVPTARAEGRPNGRLTRLGLEVRAGKREAQMQLRVWEAYQGARRRSSSAPSVHVADAMPCI
ncbi:hypothetical protein B0H14DRAFT_3010529 [Mycena olivaceomarginata]|nr:hypothetical protein B0H14DRAFT_3010529 [Mycena olivaceomarginata]